MISHEITIIAGIRHELDFTTYNWCKMWFWMWLWSYIHRSITSRNTSNTFLDYLEICFQGSIRMRIYNEQKLELIAIQKLLSFARLCLLKPSLILIWLFSLKLCEQRSNGYIASFFSFLCTIDDISFGS